MYTISGGGVFTKVGKIYELVGIVNSVQSLFTNPNTDDLFNGAIYDAGGLIAGDDTITNTSADIPTRNYATSIRVRLGWIDNVLAGKIDPSASAGVHSGTPVSR